MQEPRLYGALHDAHRKVEQERAGQDEAEAAMPQQASGRYYGELREAHELPATGSKLGRTDEPEPEAVNHPIQRSWPMQQGMATQQRAANVWARQNNEALSQLAGLREAARDARAQEQEAFERAELEPDDPEMEV